MNKDINAIDIVRQMVADGQISQDVAEKYFPELKESEEVRIRQDIITTLSMGVSCKESALHPGAHTTLKEAIDWLEKQGDKDEEILILKDQIESLHAAIKAIKETHRIELEKQGEQKQDVNIQINPSEYINDMGGNGCYLKNTTRASAWSEEDETIRQDIENLIHFALEDGSVVSPAAHTTKEGAISWTQSLKDRIQPKQEWSEEDEKMLQNILECLRHGWKKLPTDILKYETWLKSLKDRYTWKPSDKQMQALSGAGNSFRPFEEGHKVLWSLYNDLKKLREE